MDTEIGKRQVICETVYINRKYFKSFICCGLDVKRAINCILPKIMCFLTLNANYLLLHNNRLYLAKIAKAKCNVYSFEIKKK